MAGDQSKILPECYCDDDDDDDDDDLVMIII